MNRNKPYGILVQHEYTDLLLANKRLSQCIGEELKAGTRYYQVRPRSLMDSQKGQAMTTKRSIEYRIDQVAIGERKHYSSDLTHFIDRAWSLKTGDMLESVYVVVETMGAEAGVRLKVDDLWITQTW